MKKLKAFKQAVMEHGSLKYVLFHTSWAITLTSGLSYFFGLIRDRVFANTFGLSRTLDIYNAAFSIPEFVQQIVVNAALSAAFMPVFIKLYDEKKGDGYEYANQIISWFVTLLIILIIITGIIMPQLAPHTVPGFTAAETAEYVKLSRLMLITPIIFALSGVYGRILLSVKEYFWWGLAPALYNLGIILGAVFLHPIFGSTGLIYGVLIGSLFHLGIRLSVVRSRKYKFKHKFTLKISPAVKETFVLTLPKILQYAMWSFMLISFVSIASELPEGRVTAYGYARNFQSLPVSLLGIAISLAMFTTLSHDAGKGNWKKFKRDFKMGLIKCFSYTSIGAILLALFSTPLIRLLLGGGAFTEADILFVSSLLKVYCLAVPLESILHMFHRAYYSVKNTVIPALLHTFTISMTIMTAKNLAPQLDVFAIPISFASWMTLHMIILAIIFPYVLRRKEANLPVQ